MRARYTLGVSFSAVIEGARPLALGCMGWGEEGRGGARSATRRALDAFEAALIADITLFDLADVYGDGAAEKCFAEALLAFPEARERISIWSKGGIGDGHYDCSGGGLEAALNASLARLGVERLDLYLVHRPDPLSHPRETAHVLNAARRDGRIGAVGVSNYGPEQLRALEAFLDEPIAAHQFEINALRLHPVYEGFTVPEPRVSFASGTAAAGDGMLDLCMARDIVPLAYSPLGRGVLARCDSDDGRERDVQDVVGRLACELDVTRVQIALAWLWSHPAGIVPVFGSLDPVHIFEAAQRTDLRLSRAQWYEVWLASWGRALP